MGDEGAIQMLELRSPELCEFFKDCPVHFCNSVRNAIIHLRCLSCTTYLLASWRCSSDLSLSLITSNMRLNADPVFISISSRLNCLVANNAWRGLLAIVSANFSA